MFDFFCGVGEIFCVFVFDLSYVNVVCVIDLVYFEFFIEL